MSRESQGGTHCVAANLTTVTCEILASGFHPVVAFLATIGPLTVFQGPYEWVSSLIPPSSSARCRFNETAVTEAWTHVSTLPISGALPVVSQSCQIRIVLTRVHLSKDLLFLKLLWLKAYQQAIPALLVFLHGADRPLGNRSS